jgi:hypothetical protein
MGRRQRVRILLCQQYIQPLRLGHEKAESAPEKLYGKVSGRGEDGRKNRKIRRVYDSS